MYKPLTKLTQTIPKPQFTFVLKHSRAAITIKNLKLGAIYKDEIIIIFQYILFVCYYILLYK